MSRKYPEANITMPEVWHNETNRQVAASVHKNLKSDFSGVPEVVIGDVIFIGSRDIPEKTEQQIQDWLKKNKIPSRRPVRYPYSCG